TPLFESVTPVGATGCEVASAAYRCSCPHCGSVVCMLYKQLRGRIVLEAPMSEKGRKMVDSAPDRSGPPRHSARATRSAGERMRSTLLDTASALFREHGLSGTSITAIAAAADAFPSQVTYYFRSKEALFVEAACRDVLHLAERIEKAAARARTPKAYA